MPAHVSFLSVSQKTSSQSPEARKEIADLKEKLAAKESDLGMYVHASESTISQTSPAILRKQASQNFKEYDRLATELNTISGNSSDKRRD